MKNIVETAAFYCINIASIVAKNQDWENTDEDGKDWDQCFNSCENHQTGIANKWTLSYYGAEIRALSSTNFII
jgi:hypothetical protein